jgi:Arc/MetJ-type ribon-helix-helix transcriptional regulator
LPGYEGVNERADRILHGLEKIFWLDGYPGDSYAFIMEVQLTADQKAFARQAIQTGRLHREEDAVQEALVLWEERERTRAELLSAIDAAEASIARGEGRVITQQSMRDLAAEVNQRGRARLAAEKAAAV